MDSQNESVSANEVDPIKSAPAMELAFLFLRLGLTAFGGPAAHIALMQQEVVERRAWMSNDQYLDLVGAANLIPGPSSTEVAILIGFRMAGWLGLLLSGICFIFPAFVLTLIIAWAYVRFGRLPHAGGILYGVKPVVIAVVLQAQFTLGRTAVKSKLLAAIGAAAVLLAFFNISPLLLLLAAGLLTGAIKWVTGSRQENLKPLISIVTLVGALAGLPIAFRRLISASIGLGLQPLFLVFLKLGAVVYGSGYVLLAFLRSEFVTQRAWLTAGQLLDSVAVGQLTPGPVFTTATFIGYVLAGPVGAIIATVGIFLPSFLFVAIFGPNLRHLRNSPKASAFLDGVNMAALALMAAVTWQLGRSAIVDLLTGILAIGSAFLLIRFRLNVLWLLLGGAAAGLAASLMVEVAS
jgi:chromate transporter